MSEFEKLMKSGGSKRSTIQQRQQERKDARKGLLWLLGISLFFTIVPPHFGLIIFIPTLIGVFIYQGREWMG
jgi:hypothetical protein